jgi:AcrR family transcriptional regulator
MKKKSSDTRVSRIRGASSERRERQKQELRRSILKAAGEEFLAHGYENFSLRRVAETIGYSATTIYLYFQNKDDLLLATVQDGFESFDQKMKDVAASTKEPLKRIQALGRAYIEFGLQNAALYRLMFMQRSDFYFMPRWGSDTENIQDETPTARIAAQELLVEAVRAGMAAGVIKKGEPFITADVLWAGAHGLVSLANSPLMSPDHAQKVTNLLLTTLIDGIKIPKQRK